MTRLLPYCDGRRREVWVGEIADGNGHHFWKAVVVPVHGGTANRTEMKGQRMTAFGCSRPRRSLAGDVDLLAAKARLIAGHGTGAALARQAVAH